MVEMLYFGRCIAFLVVTAYTFRLSNELLVKEIADADDGIFVPLFV